MENQPKPTISLSMERLIDFRKQEKERHLSNLKKCNSDPELIIQEHLRFIKLIRVSIDKTTGSLESAYRKRIKLAVSLEIKCRREDKLKRQRVQTLQVRAQLVRRGLKVIERQTQGAILEEMEKGTVPISCSACEDSCLVTKKCGKCQNNLCLGCQLHGFGKNRHTKWCIECENVMCPSCISKGYICNRCKSYICVGCKCSCRLIIVPDYIPRKRN